MIFLLNPNIIMDEKLLLDSASGLGKLSGVATAVPESVHVISSVSTLEVWSPKCQTSVSIRIKCIKHSDEATGDTPYVRTYYRRDGQGKMSTVPCPLARYTRGCIFQPLWQLD